MAIGRVAGNMLMSDLDRLGVDLQITTGSNPLFYLDLSNFRAVINGNASTATETFTVFGSAKLDDIVVSQSTISSATNITITAPQIDLGNLNNLIIAGGSPDYILTTNGLGVLSWQDITNLVPDLVTYVDIAIAKAGEASASASAALTSETNAEASATSAQNSESVISNLLAGPETTELLALADEIQTVSTNIESVNTVSTNIDSVNTVASGVIPVRTVTGSGLTIIIDADTTDILNHTVSDPAGILAVSAPSGTPYNFQRIVLFVQTTNQQTYNWSSAFSGSTDLPLPVSVLGGEYLTFVYNSVTTKWNLLTKLSGF